MAFYCQVQLDDEIVALINRDVSKWRRPDEPKCEENPDELIRRMRLGWVFYTPESAHFLQPIWKLHKVRAPKLYKARVKKDPEAASSKLPFSIATDSPLRDETGRFPVFWREAAKNQRGAFVSLPPGPGGETDEGNDPESLLAHRWIQAQLVNLGVDEMRERAQMEFPVPGGKIDVAWFGSMIAWEVDRTLQNLSDQQTRSELRKDAGYKLIFNR